MYVIDFPMTLKNSIIKSMVGISIKNIINSVHYTLKHEVVVFRHEVHVGI